MATTDKSLKLSVKAGDIFDDTESLPFYNLDWRSSLPGPGSGSCSSVPVITISDSEDSEDCSPLPPKAPILGLDQDPINDASKLNFIPGNLERIEGGNDEEIEVLEEMYTCSINCLSMTGFVPSIECCKCWCLFHHICVGIPLEVDAESLDNFVCQNCMPQTLTNPGTNFFQMLEPRFPSDFAGASFAPETKISKGLIFTANPPNSTTLRKRPQLEKERGRKQPASFVLIPNMPTVKQQGVVPPPPLLKRGIFVPSIPILTNRWRDPPALTLYRSHMSGNATHATPAAAAGRGKNLA